MIAAGDALLQSATASRNGNSRLSASGEAILDIQAQKSRTAEQALAVEGVLSAGACSVLAAVRVRPQEAGSHG
jgi:hypothetical protein